MIAGKHALRKPNTPRGPERWQRAAVNAALKPNTNAARLFHGRIANAHLTRESGLLTEIGWQHKNRTWDWISRTYQPADTPRYYTCSVFCMAMIVQLDYATVLEKDNTSVFQFIQHTDLVVPGRPSRPVRCFYCGGNV